MKQNPTAIYQSANNSLRTTHKTTEGAIQIHRNYKNGRGLGDFYLAKQLNNHIHNLKNRYIRLMTTDQSNLKL